jgi:hypothetical protein
VAVDGSGDVFVADTLNNAVKEVLPDGAILTIGSGFNQPSGVAVDGSGDVFVADTLNNAVKEVLPDGAILSIGSGFNLPSGVAVDGSGDVFVADTHNSAVKEVLPGGAIKTFGSGFEPYGLAVDGAGDMFVADPNNSAVDEFSPSTAAATPSPLTGASAQAISATPTGLTPDTFYFYRAVAFSAGGTVVGPLRAFNTQVATSFAGLASNPTSITYGAGSVPLSGQVVANPALPLPAGSEVSVSINGLTETSLVNPDGTFQLDYHFATPPGVGQSPLTVTYSFLDPNGVFAPVSDSSRTLTVTRAAPNVSLSQVNLTYGTALANGQLSGTATWTVDGVPFTVPGTFSYTTPGTVPGVGNGQAESVTFTPSDMSDYNPVTSTVLVNVAQATPTVSVAGPPSSVFGQPVTFTATVAAPQGGTPTGSVAFYDGLTLIGTVTLSGGTASVSTGTLAVGGHAITADYMGDANFIPGSSSGLELSVGRDNTSLTVATSSSPAPFGQPVTFTATVAPAAPGAITPTTGSVQFKIDGKPVGSPVALNGTGMASYAISTLAIGTHSVSATYVDTAGDYNGSTGALAPAQPIDATTQTALTASTGASVYSQAVTFTATVSTADTTATPTGSVQFYVDGVLARTVALSSGTASYATSTLAVATAPHVVYAKYLPSGSFLGGTSASQSVAVSQVTTTTSVIASMATAYPGQAVTITATVASASPATAVPTGLVRFYLNGGATVWRTAGLGAGGVVNLSVTNLPVGADTITASYVGTANLAASTAAAPASVTIDQAPTVITLNPVPAATTYGTPVTLSAGVTSTDTSATLTGLVQFYDNGVKLGGAVGVSGGTATLKLAATALIAGSHPITAVFLGSPNFLASGPTPSQTITVGSAATSLSAGVTVAGTTVTFAGTVADVAAAPAGMPVPTGVVKIMNGSTILATVGVTAAGTFTRALTLAHGTYTVTVLYVPATNAQGETNFAGGSGTLMFTV